MEYHNIDCTGWPDAVVVDNGGDIFEHAYETRIYFPVDRDALLGLAEEMEDLVEAWGGKYPANRVAAYARRIREILEGSDA